MRATLGASYFDELCPPGSQTRMNADAYWGADDDGYCHCEGHDGSGAGYICDECEREIPEPRTLCDFEHEGR